MITRKELDKLLQETDWVMLDDVKDTIGNIDEFIFYRNNLREIRKACEDDENIFFTLPVKPNVVWELKVEE